jgi:hypothetical protein
MFSPVDVIKVNFLVVDVLELDVLGARPNKNNYFDKKSNSNKCQKKCASMQRP